MQRRAACADCGAEWKLVWDLDPDYYDHVHCPFCGAELDNELTHDEDSDS
jgi:hypothetical protein